MGTITISRGRSHFSTLDDALIDTLVVKNVNPIEKLERSSLIVAETIQGVQAASLIKSEAYDAIAMYAAGPALLPPRE